MLVQGIVGPGAAQSIGPGTAQAMRLGQLGDVINSELHGRFYETTYRGNAYSNGLNLTSISSALFTTATLGATQTPILGVWNPVSSTVNLVILQATLAITITALTATGAGPFAWASSTGNAALTLGSAPINRKTLAGAGSQAKGMAGIALTGLTNAQTVLGGSALGGGSVYNVSEVGTAAGFHTQLVGFVENLDGSIIVPPGGTLSLLATATPVAHSATANLLWEEVPI